jgi:hypothetical protein
MRLTLLLIVILSCFSCRDNTEVDKYERGIDQRIAILTNDLKADSTFTVNFYWEDMQTGKTDIAAISKNTDVTFERPYVIASGVRFHLDDFRSTNGQQNSHGDFTSMSINFKRPK